MGQLPLPPGFLSHLYKGNATANRYQNQAEIDKQSLGRIKAAIRMSRLHRAFLMRLNFAAAAVGNVINWIVARAVCATANKIKLNTVHDFHGVRIMRVIIDALLNTLFHSPRNLIAENVTSDARSNLNNKQRRQQNPKRKQHAMALLKRSAAAKEGNNCDGSSNNHYYDGHVPETFIDEAGIIMVVQLVLNDAPKDQRRQPSQLKF